MQLLLETGPSSFLKTCWWAFMGWITPLTFCKRELLLLHSYSRQGRTARLLWSISAMGSTPWLHPDGQKPSGCQPLTQRNLLAGGCSGWVFGGEGCLMAPAPKHLDGFILKTRGECSIKPKSAFPSNPENS